MKKNKKLINFLFFSLILIIVALPKLSYGLTQDVCTKSYYRPTDIVGYFFDNKSKEALYITYDWCVVKPLLWYGTIFGTYNVSKDQIQQNLEYIFPEKQVYYGLIPGYFFKDGGNYIQRGKFTTKQHLNEKTGYFLNDNPFKNIFGGNFPKPPRFVNDPSIFQNYGTATPKGTIAPLIMDRMAKLHDIFANEIAKGYCNIIAYAQKKSYYCDYFSIRTKVYTPSAYFGLDKLPEYKTQ